MARPLLPSAAVHRVIQEEKQHMEAELPVETFAVRVLLTDAVLLDLMDYSYTGQHSQVYLDALATEVTSTLGDGYSYEQVRATYGILKTEVIYSDGQMYMFVHFDRLKEQALAS